MALGVCLLDAFA
ncbi:hypothetical protein PGI88_004247 [Vibrio vulnificus]|nr:hypothetical protein [Vibrio vulnificus]